MNKGIVAVIVLGSLSIRCASLPHETADVRGVRYTLETWAIGVTAQDLDTIMSTYSEKFAYAHRGGKAWMRGVLDDSMRQGGLRDARVNLENVQIAIDGETATASGIQLGNPASQLQVFGFTLRREEDGIWRIIEMDMS